MMVAMDRPTYGRSADDATPMPPRRNSPRYDYGLPGEPTGSGQPTSSASHADAARPTDVVGDDGPARPTGSPQPPQALHPQATYPSASPHASSSASAQVGGYGQNISGGAQKGPTVCPRHPDRPSYVRCQRCAQPACGECQRPAPVGMLCVTCEQRLIALQANSAPRDSMGGSMRRAGTPVVTYAVMAAAIAGFLGQALFPQLMSHLFLFIPGLAQWRPWTFVTSGFLHGGIFHLVLNMWALWAIGKYIEQSLGHWRYAAIFLLSVIGGHVAVLFFTSAVDPTEWFRRTLGASGGIFGLFGALFVLNRRMGAQSGQVLALIAMNLVLTFTVPGISWQGHLGGLIVGAAVMSLLFVTRPKATPGDDRARLARVATMRHAAVVLACIALLIGLVIVRFLMVGAL